MHAKAEAGDFLGRFREIVSDPLNLLIRRHPLAGTIEDDSVYLHNGHKVARSGPYAYYGEFSNILVINRGVHEPLEEFVFQELLNVLPESPLMLELGAYWAHYSMWLQQARPKSVVYLVEPEADKIEVGQYNFERHGYTGKFVQDFVGKGRFEVDQFMKRESLEKLDVLHSDIQGFEAEMLDGCVESLRKKSIDYLFISTHGQELHAGVVGSLTRLEYRVEVASDFDSETTSFDGFVFASSPTVPAVFHGFSPLGRTQIIQSQPRRLIHELTKTFNSPRSSQPTGSHQQSDSL